MTTSLAPFIKQFFDDNSGIPLSGGKLFSYLAGTTTKVTTYTDSTGGTPNTNPIILNTRGEANVWLTPGVSYKFTLSPSTDTDPPTNPIWTVDNVPASNPVFEFWGGTSTGSANAYALAAPAVTAYLAPLAVIFIANFTNTGATTVNVNGLGAKNVFRKTGTGIAACGGGEIRSGDIVELQYDGTQFQIVSPPVVKQMIGGNSTNTLAAGATAFIGIGSVFTVSEQNAQIPVPFAATLRNLFVRSAGTAGVGETYTYTLQVNTVATALTAQIAGGSATTASDTTHSVTVAAGDLIDIKIVTSGGASVTTHNWSMEIDPT